MKKNRQGQTSMTPEEIRKTIGSKMDAAVAEAYKLLRANLNVSIPEDRCKVIGVISALEEDVKSATPINIAYTAAQTGKKVLLVEADLRKPSIGEYLQLQAGPGLVGLLTGKCGISEALRESGLNPNLRVIPAGSTASNPAELLGSAAMESNLKEMSEQFDEIVVELPPVTAVSDALAAAKFLDGMVVLVRDSYCDKAAVDETVRQLRFAGVKILGFVLTGADAQKKAYRRYGHYGENS